MKTKAHDQPHGSPFEFAIIENSGRFGNSTDIGLHAGWRTAF
jgi:hypothetical protein